MGVSMSCIFVFICMYVCVCVCYLYGVATVSRLLKIIGLFYRISSLL